MLLQVLTLNKRWASDKRKCLTPANQFPLRTFSNGSFNVTDLVQQIKNT